MHDVFLIWIRSEQCKNKCTTLSCEPNNQLNIIVCTILVTEGEVAGLKLAHCLLSIFNLLLFSFFESRSGLVSFQTDHSIWCVPVAFLTKPKPHFKVLPGHLR